METLKLLAGWFRPTFDALFNFNLPFTLRWRLLGFQPIALLSNTMLYLPEINSRDYKVIRIPSRRGHHIRAIVFQPPSSSQHTGPRPLHVDFHGGAFLGGNAEYDARFCRLLSKRTGTVVISAEYRHAPRYTYPCAHEDAEDVLEWALEHARDKFNADPNILTVSGSSAGANLMMIAGNKAKAAVGFQAPLDFRIPPWKKPKPEKMPKTDPLAFMMPLFDAYAGPARSESSKDSRLNPILTDASQLPLNMLFIVPAIDILAYEQLEFVRRVKTDDEKDGRKREIEAVVFENGFHGWLDLPTYIVGDDDRNVAFDAAIAFVAKHRRREIGA